MKVCANCGEENPERARFCIACGTELTGEEAVRFRKVITLLFCDLINGGELAQRMEPDDLSQALGTYYDAMRPIIEGHGGTVAKFIGDAIMSVFGVPILHEDDALRACRAALDMRERLVDVNAELEERWGVTLKTRMGINTGEVSGVGVARAQNFVAGDAANTAARFQQNAQAGQTLFGDDTYRLVRDGVRVDEVDALTMKGKEGKVRAYNLVEVLADAEALLRRHHAPLVGREHELELVERTFLSTVDEWDCRLVALLADAGVGKSRLVEELARRVVGAARIARGRCLSYGEGITFWPLVEIVRDLAGIDQDDSPEAARTKLLAVAGDGGEDAVERVASAVGLSDVSYPLTEIFWGTRQLLEHAAARAPLIVVFDDVHWAEPALLDLIEHLLDTVSEAPVLIICPARPEFLDARPEWPERNDVTEVRLRPLTDDEVARVIANMLGDVDLADEARNRIVEAAEGNPLFVEQMLSMMLDEGLLQRVDDRYEATAEVASVEVPPSINALLAARVDHLPSEQRAVVDPAAVVGLEFRQDAVEELATDDVKATVPDSLVRLTDKQLVRQSGDAGDGNEFRFYHLLIRDAAYEGLLKETRASLHERVAGWTERMAGERGGGAEFDEILGYHLEQAHRYRAELGPLDEHGRELGIRAATYLAAAGRRAFERSDMQAAANLLGRAVDLRPKDDLVRLQLVPTLAEALFRTGEFTHALKLLDETIERAAALDSESLVAEATIVKLTINAFVSEEGVSSEIVPEVESAMAVLERDDHHAGLAKGWRVLGLVHGTACRYGEASHAVRQAIVHARLAGDRRQELANASAYAQAVLSGPTPVSEAIVECERIIERAGGDRGARAFNLAILSMLQAMEGAQAEARTSYVAARALYEDLGNVVLAAWVSLFSGPAELLAGDLDAADRELTRAYDTLVRIGEKYYRSTVAAILGQLRYEQGRFEEARLLAQIGADLSTPDDVESQALWRSVHAKVLAREGSVGDALVLAQEAVSLSYRTDSPTIQADALVDFGEVLELTGRDPNSVLLEAESLYEIKGNVVGAEKVSRLLAARAGSPKS